MVSFNHLKGEMNNKSDSVYLTFSVGAGWGSGSGAALSVGLGVGFSLVGLGM